MKIKRYPNLDAEKAAASARIEAFLDSGPKFALSEGGKITIDYDEMYDGGRFSRFDRAPSDQQDA